MKLQPYPDVFDGWTGNLADIVLIRAFQQHAVKHKQPLHNKQNQQNNYPLPLDYPTATVCPAMPATARSLTIPRKHHTLPV